MKRIWYALPLLLLAAPVAGNAAEQLIPAGSLIQCTVSEPKLSSKNIDCRRPDSMRDKPLSTLRPVRVSLWQLPGGPVPRLQRSGPLRR